MVAVALLPPLTVVGLLLGAGELQAARRRAVVLWSLLLVLLMVVIFSSAAQKIMQ
jgi:uncharacterized membrane protein